MKRFYKDACAIATAGGAIVELDGLRLKTPAKDELAIPNMVLAEAIAAEWREQGETIEPDLMPLMSYVSTAIDWVIPQHQAVAAEVTAFAGSDLLCYRADYPPELAAAQAEKWQPLLDWASGRYAVTFRVTAGIMPVTQDAATLMTMGRAVSGFDSFRLTGLHALTNILGSLVLALAIVEGERDVARAFTLSQIDEDFQALKWGRDEEAQTRRDRLERDAHAADRYLKLLM